MRGQELRVRFPRLCVEWGSMRKESRGQITEGFVPQK